MKLTSEEFENKSLNLETLQYAVEQVKVNGYIILEGVLSAEKIEQLHTSFMNVFTAYLKKHELNRGKNRTQMHLPFMEPFIDTDVITNPFALSVIDELLGEDCTCRYFASDTPLPGSEYQDVHSDIQPLFAESALSLPPTGIVLNIPLVDFREDNGPVEIWPGGTHLIPENANKREIIKAMAPSMYSERVLMPAGSLLIRDLRMWHRGTPNHSDRPRPNMALVYFRSWYETRPQIGIPIETYGRLSDRAKKLFRMENIGGALINNP